MFDVACSLYRFAFMVAVVLPLAAVAYSLSTFEFDREVYALNLKVFPQGRFETLARVVADPMKTALVIKALNSLQIFSTLDLLTHRHKRCLVSSISLPHKSRSSTTSSIRKLAPETPSSRPPVCVLPSCSCHICVPEHLDIPGSVFFSSRMRSACASVGIVERQRSKSVSLFLGDRHRAHGENVCRVVTASKRDKVAQLVATGDLESINIVNRQLTPFPEELRRCANMRHISLYYTHTEVLPHWFKEFSKLDYLQVALLLALSYLPSMTDKVSSSSWHRHIEGEPWITDIAELPDDMFDHMSSLTFLHLGAHLGLRHLPSFHGLTSLRSLALGLLILLEEIPALDCTAKLERIVLAFPPTPDSIPDLSPIKDLKSFVYSYRGTMCCNGFLDNKCDLSNPLCAAEPAWGIPPAACLPVPRANKIASAATRQAFAKFADTVCAATPPDSWKTVDDPPLPECIAQCNGTMYRQCELPGNRTGMCYNTRMTPISCNGNILPIEMRRRQIQEHVGVRCDPVHEAWLGCTS